MEEWRSWKIVAEIPGGTTQRGPKVSEEGILMMDERPQKEENVAPEKLRRQ